MRVEQLHWTQTTGWTHVATSRAARGAQLVLCFGATDRLRDPERMAELHTRFPAALICGCSTSGEIADTRVFDDTIVATALEFEQTTIHMARTGIEDDGDSQAAGRRLAEELSAHDDADELAHVFVLTDGIVVNGSQLVAGLTASLPAHVAVTGGLAGDGTRFASTLVIDGAQCRTRVATAIGLYGSALRVGFGSLGGWDPFGPERVITKATGNVLYELDGRSALGLYKRYLEGHAAGLPASALLFPLSLRHGDGTEPTVRTILGIDEQAQSMTFAGDMPVGGHAQLMKANFDRLIDGATGAARTSHESIGSQSPDVALLISCVGRKLVLKQRIEEEVEAVRDVLGATPVLAGFYSYGEVSPFTRGARCQLHNQTMTITTLAER